jgi:hypothetical protein
MALPIALTTDARQPTWSLGCAVRSRPEEPFMTIRNLISATTALVTVVVAVVPSTALAGLSGASIANVRDATAVFNDPVAALAAGYELLTDAADIACIDQPGSGAMGIHYVKSALVQSGKIDAVRPQALVYERVDGGRLQLAGVEYVVLQADWDAAHTAPPSLFGEEFNITSAENRYGLPSFYSLHVWVWKDNPSGVFSMWNPAIGCAPASDPPAHTIEH